MTKFISNLHETMSKTLKSIFNTKFLLIFSLVNVLLILLLCINSFNQSDDFGFIYNLKKVGVLQYCIDGYYGWDGRFLSLSGFFQGFCLLHLPPELVTFIWSLCLFISGFLIYNILNLDFGFEIKNKTTKKFAILFFGIILWLGSIIHLCETVYWATGGVYTFSLMIGVFWVFFFLKLQKGDSSIIYKLIFILFSFVASGLTYNLSVALITLSIIFLITDFLQKENKNLIFNVLIIIGLIFGLMFIILAPGNFIRISTSENSTYNNFSILYLIKNYFYVFAKYIFRSGIAILLSFMTALAFGYLLFSKSKITKIEFLLPKNKLQFATFLQNYKWLFAALSTIFPFITIPHSSAKRTIVFFMYFLILFIFSFVFELFTTNQKNQKNEKNQNSEKFAEKSENINKSNTFFGTVLIICLLFVSYNLILGFNLKKQIAERENLFKKSTNKTVHVKLINKNEIPPCYIFTDFSPNNDVKDFVRNNYETEFNVKIIVNK